MAYKSKNKKTKKPATDWDKVEKDAELKAIDQLRTILTEWQKTITS